MYKPYPINGGVQKVKKCGLYTARYGITKELSGYKEAVLFDSKEKKVGPSWDIIG